MLVGVWRPTVLLPSAAEASLSEGELRATLLHELAHVKRRDVAALWLFQAVQLAFFFHPALWLAGRQMRKERELACDEMVLSRGGVSREEYASGYVQALKSASGAHARAIALAMAEPFEMEKRRLEMILHAAVPRLSFRWVVAYIAVAAIALLTFRAQGDEGQGSFRQVPVYPGARLVTISWTNNEALTASSQLAYVCDAPPDKVVSFYRSRLAKEGTLSYRLVPVSVDGPYHWLILQARGAYVHVQVCAFAGLSHDPGDPIVHGKLKGARKSGVLIDVFLTSSKPGKDRK